MPPTPKPAAQRQRRNRVATAATLDAPPATYRDLAELAPGRPWHPLTLAWWRVIWSSPRSTPRAF